MGHSSARKCIYCRRPLYPLVLISFVVFLTEKEMSLLTWFHLRQITITHDLVATCSCLHASSVSFTNRLLFFTICARTMNHLLARCLLFKWTKERKSTTRYICRRKSECSRKLLCNLVMVGRISTNVSNGVLIRFNLDYWRKLRHNSVMFQGKIT